MVTIENPKELMAYAIASNSVDALINWIAVMEEREDMLYTVQGQGGDTFPVLITFPQNEGARPMRGGLMFHDYADTPYWQVHT